MINQCRAAHAVRSELVRSESKVLTKLDSMFVLIEALQKELQKIREQQKEVNKIIRNNYKKDEYGI